MGEPSKRARELLAAEFERSDHAGYAADVRRGKMPGHGTPLWMDEALRAIDKAIAEERAAVVAWLLETGEAWVREATDRAEAATTPYEKNAARNLNVRGNCLCVFSLAIKRGLHACDRDAAPRKAEGFEAEGSQPGPRSGIAQTEVPK